MVWFDNVFDWDRPVHRIRDLPMLQVHVSFLDK